MEREAIGMVMAERARQRGRWGEEQPHPLVVKTDVTAPEASDLYTLPSAHEARARLAGFVKHGGVTFTDILLEEVAEAVEASALHGELADESLGEWVQVTAVALQMVETILRRRARSGAPVVGWDADGREVVDGAR